jgi:hypothetical protein
VKVQVKSAFSKEAQPGRGAQNSLRKEVITRIMLLLKDFSKDIWPWSSFIF